MKIKCLFIAAVVTLFSVVVFGQNTPKRSLDDFAGRWEVDLENSFSRAERGKLSTYTLNATAEGDTLTMEWEFVIDRSPSRIHETFKVDRKEHRYQRKEFPIQKTLFFDFGHFLNIRAYRATLDKERLKITFQQPLSDSMSAYLDKRTLELGSDANTLTIETVIRSARPGDASRNQSKRLTLTRLP